jgi:ATP-dependent Clp protease ATP-binding subunit ClpA
MFSKALEFTLNLAFARAREKRHEFMTVEHLLLALLDNPEANQVLLACGANLERLRAGLGIFIEETTPHIPLEKEQDTQPTLGFQRVLQRAIFQVQSAGKAEVTGANVLAAIFGEQESQAIYFLSQESVTRVDINNYLAHGISKVQHHGDVPHAEPGTGHEEGGGMGMHSSESALEKFAVNLNELAKAGKIDPLVGRHELVARAIQVLCRRRKNNPLLVGEAGVGKTAIAEGLAQLIVEHKVPAQMAHHTVYSLDLGVLLAGTKYRGDFEKRFKSLLKELKNIPGAIVFIDEIHTIIGAGAASGGTIDASNLLKPLLANGEVHCMGATTYQEYRNIFEKDRALARRFQKIDVPEPTLDETFSILQGLKQRFESHHGVRYTNQALRAAADLSARYITDRYLPDKAIDVVDEAGAYQALQSPSRRKKIIGIHEIEEIVANMARIPSKNVSTSDIEQLRQLDRNLKMLVFGQDQAIDSLSAAIKLSRSGLRVAEKPVGCFLFTGPTGVGKTEVTQQLASVLGVNLIRFDMSEYMERHTVSRLIGAPPGYVGYDQGGLLTDAVTKHPHSVLLLDEIEKAHSDVYNLLLQIMDYGRLTDNNGRTADFRHVILVMTSNAGADMLERPSIGFTQQDKSQESLQSIKSFFTPEFRNRLDAVIQFNHLSPETLTQVVDKFITELEVQLQEKRVGLEVETAARQWLARNGYDRTMGARPMARLIEEKIKKPLADELLFGQLARGGKLVISEKDNQLHFTITHAEGNIKSGLTQSHPQ